jgi:hypothetical protein
MVYVFTNALFTYVCATCGLSRVCGNRALVESEALVWAFSPGSTLELGLKAFRRRGSKCWLETPPFTPGWYNEP